jgi:DUF1365 family protein
MPETEVDATLIGVMAELAKLRELLETVARLSCPVCAPKVIAEIHPEAVKVLAQGNHSRNGHR